MKLIWSSAAADDLAELVSYIEDQLDSPKAAERLANSIIEKAVLFARMPGAGVRLRTRHGVDTGYRYMSSGNWMIFFTCNDDEALVVRILYAKSNYMKTLFGDSLGMDG